MDGFFAVIILAGLAIPVLAIAGFFLALGARTQNRLLEARLASLELRIAQQGPAAPPVATAQEPEPAPSEAAIAPEPATPPPEPLAEPAVPPTWQPPVSTPQPPSPPPAGPSFEERFGTQWVVWAGGLALALGGYFLVRYSIEQGWFGPGVRILMGAVLAAALVAAGEWARRTERLSGVTTVPSAHIPSILTAAGTAVAYAVAWAAYVLYGFLGPGPAFVLLGIVALLTLAAALLHGPALAALGLIGAYLTPLLVSTAQPNYWALYVYLAVVSAASFALARMRLWRWLAISAVVLGALWMLPGIGDVRTDVLMPHAFHAVAGFSLAAALIVAGFLYGPPAPSGQIDAISSGAIGAYVLAAALLTLATDEDTAALLTFVLLVGGTVAVAWRSEAAMAAVPAAAALAVLVLADWAVDVHIVSQVARGGPAAPIMTQPPRALFGTHLTVGALLAVLFGGAGFLAQGRSERPEVPMLWAASGVIAPLAILVALYYRIAEFDRSVPFAALALLISALYAGAVEMLGKREPRPGMAAAGAIYAAGSIAALALALTFALEKGWLTVALALMVPGIAWVAQKRPLPLLRWAAAAGVMLVLARIAWEPRIVGDDVGTTPIFNWLLYGYGGPAAAFWVGGYLLRRRADDVPSRMVESAAILFTVLLGFLEVRHYFNDGDVYSDSSGLGEVALDVVLGLAMAIGLERMRARTANVVHNAAALIIAAVTAVGGVIGLWFVQNPLLTDEPIHGAFFNLILLGYGVPAVLAAILALVARTTRPLAYRFIAAAFAVGLALAYLSLQIRRLYHGPELIGGPTTNAEQYTYSAAWLALGVVLLLIGVALRSQPARLASAAVVLITIGKVFLFDLAVLEGAFRALSFIALGLVLVGIGWLYQRLLFPRLTGAAPAVAAAE